MAYSSAWLRFRKAQEEYFTSRYAFMQNEMLMVSDLSAALADAGHTDTALRFSLRMQPKVEVTLLLLASSIDLAVDSSSYDRIS